MVERARWQGERSGGVSLGGERSRRTVYPGVRRREGGERSGGEKTERRGCDELTTLRSGAPPRCTADTCQLANLSACWEVGELESWRGAGGAGGVIAECSDCIVLSVRVGGFLVYPGVRRGRGGERSGGEKTERRGWDEV